MARFEKTKEFAGAEFVRSDLSGVRIIRSDMENAWLRATFLDGAVIEAVFLDECTVTVNGVDIVPLVEAELDRRWPGRELRHRKDPEGLRQAWSALEAAWAAAIDRVATMPAGTVDVSVEDEWTLTQTLRHLIFAIDAWLGKGILDQPEPFHPFGQPHGNAGDDGFDASILVTDPPAHDDVVATLRGRQAMVRDFLATVTPEVLAEPRPFVWDPQHMMDVVSCVHVILGESWEHLRFATRDLDAIEAAATHVPSEDGAAT